MAIVGIGTDLLSIERVRVLCKRHEARFAKRILHAQEWQAYLDSADKPRLLAKRFAVKEAASKALGTGIRNGITLQDFYLTRGEYGKPELHLSGEGLVVANAQGVTECHVSLSDELDQVLAFVILERNA